MIFFCIYRLTLKYTPKLIFNKNGEIVKILSKMTSVKKPYRPTPWLFNKHLQTIYSLKLRGKTSYKPQREDVFFKMVGKLLLNILLKIIYI